MDPNSGPMCYFRIIPEWEKNDKSEVFQGIGKLLKSKKEGAEMKKQMLGCSFSRLILESGVKERQVAG